MKVIFFIHVAVIGYKVLILGTWATFVAALFFLSYIYPSCVLFSTNSVRSLKGDPWVWSCALTVNTVVLLLGININAVDFNCFCQITNSFTILVVTSAVNATYIFVIYT